MRLTRLLDGTSLLLPDDLLWTDEHAWTQAASRIEYLLTGALLVESAARQAGRPITLTGPSDMAWVRRSLVNTLHSWAQAPNERFTLELSDGRIYTVAFRHHESALEAEPVLGFPARGPDDRYRLSLRLIEV